jgi:sugar phosphate isomerase/epimerase
MNNRREFIRQICMATGGLALGSLLPSCSIFERKEKFTFNISLAQWSLHKALFSKEIDALDFPVIARTKFEIEAVEYVNQFFKDKGKDQQFLNELKERCDDNGVKSLLIMIDGEGDLADEDASKRNEAVENHYKWIEAAKFLGCHSIRVNLHGSKSEEEWKKASVESLGKLTEFGSKNQVNVIVENHGGFSSNGKLVAEVMKEVNNERCGTLPDFGNFCMRREKGDLWESPCVEWYDRYQGVKEMLPYAKGVSAKSFDFDEKGNETTIDFQKMLNLVKDSGFKGYLGVEYEGERLSEEEGIRATKKLLEKIRDEMEG